MISLILLILKHSTDNIKIQNIKNISFDARLKEAEKDLASNSEVSNALHSGDKNRKINFKFSIQVIFFHERKLDYIDTCKIFQLIMIVLMLMIF